MLAATWQPIPRAARASGIGSDREELEAWTSLARILLTANEFLYIE